MTNTAPTDDSAHAHARRLGALGLRALPIKKGHKYPPFNSWQHAATNDPDKIDNWYSGLYRDAGTGLALGPQPCGLYLFALDIDTHDPANDGWDALSDLEHTHGALPETWRSLTGSGGGHLIFAAPAGVTVRNQQASGNRVAAGIDVRGDGGQIVVAPTIHPGTGSAYAWEHGYAPWERDVAQAPDWLLELVAETEPPPAPPKPSASDPFTTPTNSDSIAASVRDWWDWHHELTARGWTEHHRDGNDTYWTRPGKNTRDGHSAVQHGDDVLVIFTSEIPNTWTQAAVRTVDGSAWSFSPFAFIAAVDHNGDRSAAARALRAAQAPAGATTAPTGDDTPEDPDAVLRAMLIDWPEFWTHDHGDAEWLAEPILAAHRSTALFAPGGTGKSLLSLWISACLATGQDPFADHPVAPLDVLYLDYEMTADDLAERLEQMGFGADANLDRLHYALLPSLPGLDQPEGGKAVVRLAELVSADLVVIDTFGRAVHGDENEADTVRAWYRWTGLHLKHDGRAFLRVDHAGKDLSKGQRGTSAKNDDVDVVWQMTAGDAGAYTLTAKKRRMGWVPETVKITLHDADRLAFALTDGDVWPAGTADVARALDELGVPVTLSSRKAVVALREAGRGARDVIVRAAQKYRRIRSSSLAFDPDQGVDNGVRPRPELLGRGHTDTTPDAAPDAPTTNTKNHQVDESGRGAGRGGTRYSDATGTRPAYPLGDAGAQREPTSPGPNPFFDPPEAS